MSWSITNGDGTIAYQGMTEARARESAQQHADKHGEVFFVAEAGREYPEAVPNLGLGEPVSPGSPRVMDYQTGEALDGRPSPELVEASLAVPHTGAVGARRDAEGVWQLVRDDPWGPHTRTVWIQE